MPTSFRCLDGVQAALRRTSMPSRIALVQHRGIRKNLPWSAAATGERQVAGLYHLTTKKLPAGLRLRECRDEALIAFSDFLDHATHPRSWRSAKVLVRHSAWQPLRLPGAETLPILRSATLEKPRRTLVVAMHEVPVGCGIDTLEELEYLRQLAA